MAQRARLFAPLALAALSAVAALSLGRVVDSSRYVLPVLGAALLPHAIGVLFRRRNWSVWIGVAATLVGLGVFIVLALEPSTTTLGIPGADTWRALDRQLTNGWHLLRTAPAPAPATDGAILLAVIAVWCMAAVADWVAFGREATLGAIAPALVFFVWTSTLGTSDARVLVTAAFCVAAGAFLLAQNVAVLDRRRSWLVSRHAARPHWLVPASALGAGAIVFALLVAPIVPGAGSDPLLDVANSGRNDSAGRSYRPGQAPFVDIGDKLRETANQELFTVTSPQPDYWRIAALDRYTGDNGGQWTLSAEGDGSVGVGLPPVSDAPEGVLNQEFRIGPLTERWLPAAYEPVAIDLPDTLVVRSSGTIVTDAPNVSDLRYQVASRLPPLAGTVTPEQQAATDAPVPAEFRPYTASAEEHRDPRHPGHRARRRDRRGGDHALREGPGAARLLPWPGLRLRHQRRQRRQRERDPRVPPPEARVLRAVRQRLRGDGPHPRHPRPGGSGLHSRPARRRRRVPRDEPRRPRLARDLPHRARVDSPLRPDTGGPGRRDRGRQQPAPRHPGGSHGDDHTHGHDHADGHDGDARWQR